MKISIITVFPELYKKFLSTSIIKRAQESKIVSFDVIKLSDLCSPGERIDEPVCGHGAGMIIKPEVIEKAIQSCEQKHGAGFKIFFSPQGKLLDQNIFIKLSKFFLQQDHPYNPENFLPNFITKPDTNPSKDHIIIICSRYEGMDTRVEEYFCDAIFSIGNYVLMGGDIPAQVFFEGFLRLIPGVVGKQDSIEQESFTSSILDYPEYGLPKEWNGLKIPEVILSGNHAEIDKWRQAEACKKTILEKFEWFRSNNPTKEVLETCTKQLPNHYVAVMHTDILIKDSSNPETNSRVGCSSVTSLDLHDIARSSATYGIKNMFMVSPIKDQQAIMNELLDFWKSDKGKEYNLSRYNAVSRVFPTSSLKETIDLIENKEGKKPITITTSAKQHDHPQKINFFDQGKVWKYNKPVLFIFGTGQGLCDRVITDSNFLLTPVKGMTDYGHLSVRSAVAIILDRWLGLR
jgi:tRNA (guanine37-N1)-methyltransferase